jgi:anti-sigma B factor antagonist
MTSPTIEFVATLHTEGDRAVVLVAGEVDMYTAPRLAACLDEATSVTKEVVIDATNVAFIDSTGVAVLVNAMKRLGAGALRVRRAPAQMRKVLEITGLTQLIPTDD